MAATAPRLQRNVHRQSNPGALSIRGMGTTQQEEPRLLLSDGSSPAVEEDSADNEELLQAELVIADQDMSQEILKFMRQTSEGTKAALEVDAAQVDA